MTPIGGTCGLFLVVLHERVLTNPAWSGLQPSRERTCRHVWFTPEYLAGFTQVSAAP